MMPYLINMRIALIFFVTFSTTIIVEDFDNSYLAEPGDVFSADLFNEQHTNIKNVLKTWSSVDLVGEMVLFLYSYDNSNIPKMTNSYDGIYKSTGHVYVFKNDGDGTFSVSYEVENNSILTHDGAGNYALIGDIIFKGEINELFRYDYVQSKSKTRFVLHSPRFNPPGNIYNSN